MNKRRFYIAGRTKNIDLIKEIARTLSKQDMEWSFDWTAHAVFPKPYLHGNADLDRFAAACVKGVQAADLFVLLAQDSQGSRGCLIEFGTALATNAEIWIIGDENPSVFSCLSQVNHAATVEDFLRKMS